MPIDEMQETTGWGAVQMSRDTWRFSVWAPDATTVEIGVGENRTAIARTDGDWFIGTFAADAGDTYDLLIDGTACVDPAARWLSGGTEGPARLAPPVRHRGRAPSRTWEEAAILELHVGTFTTEGTFAAAARRMADLAGLGITAVELMPVVTFGGNRGWGYDGVFAYAPHPAYGSPQDLADLVDAIHGADMLAILDVVYNHFGPVGASMQQVAPQFFNPNRTTPWGPAIDFVRPAVRRFFVDNAVMWVRDFGFDGLRLDAVHQIDDPSPVHLLDEIAAALRLEVPDRPVHLIAEDDRNDPQMRDAGTIAANWNDDYHHAVHCLLTGESESYYATFAVDPVGDLVTALARGHIEQGQPREGREALRGAPSSHLPPTAFVNSNQTHDQVGNRAQGDRLMTLADPAAVRIAHAMLLTAPAIPMLFMGEEEGAHDPFLFFADFDGEMGEAVRTGRAAEFAGFHTFKGAVPDPLSRDTFDRSHPYTDLPHDADTWRDLTRQCLRWRAERLVPLLRSGRGDAAQVRATGPASVHGTWDFKAGTLEMVAHLDHLPDTPVILGDPEIVLGNITNPCHFAVKVTSR